MLSNCKVYLFTPSFNMFMKKNIWTNNRVYIKPEAAVLSSLQNSALLMSSPPVNPGGGGVDVDPFDPDDEDTDLWPED